jgi:hypothetical protein
MHLRTLLVTSLSTNQYQKTYSRKPSRIERSCENGKFEDFVEKNIIYYVIAKMYSTLSKSKSGFAFSNSSFAHNPVVKPIVFTLALFLEGNVR